MEKHEPNPNKTVPDLKDAVVAKLVELFGEENIADPEIFPKIFSHQVKMARYQIFLDTPLSTEIVVEGEKED